MIYFDSCALLKFIKAEPATEALRAWRRALPHTSELVTSDLARLEISRSLIRAGLDAERVPHFVSQALRGLYTLDLTPTVLARAASYRIPRLGSLDAVHLASAEPLGKELEHFVTYDRELADAARALGLPVLAPE